MSQRFEEEERRSNGARQERRFARAAMKKTTILAEDGLFWARIRADLHGTRPLLPAGLVRALNRADMCEVQPAREHCPVPQSVPQSLAAVRRNRARPLVSTSRAEWVENSEGSLLPGASVSIGAWRRENPDVREKMDDELKSLPDITGAHWSFAGRGWGTIVHRPRHDRTEFECRRRERHRRLSRILGCDAGCAKQLDALEKLSRRERSTLAHLRPSGSVGDFHRARAQGRRRT